MKQAAKQTRCAIYTRKSTEEGLEQDFNSLDAQREAAEAYIKSQQHEGWTLIEKRYDDGGYSGGTMERPAFKELIQDIKENKIDIVVVYKVDRLTRSLMDFSKIIEVFDKHETSFVSVTQHFNTTTSMGRLTLNILLSFAQFEREVTGERIRDKVAASKKKGMWMGGCVPIGYKRENKKLIINEEQADKVRVIFDEYLRLGSVPRLKEYLENKNIKTQTGKSFSKGQLYHILSNKIYMGKIIHKDNVYEGEHESIIIDSVFLETQKLLLRNRVDKECNIKTTSHSLLVSKIFDDNGNRMTPSHSNAHGKKYRYYVSLALTQFKNKQAGSISKIPAGEIEKFVINNVKEYFQNKNQVIKFIKNFNIAEQNTILDKLAKLNYNNPKLIRYVLEKVIVSKEWIEINLCENQIQKLFENFIYCDEIPNWTELKNDSLIVIKKNIRISASSKLGCNVLIIADNTKQTPMPNANLIKAIIKSYYWNELLLSGKVKNIKEIQTLEGCKDTSYIKDIINLRFLSPEIIETILNGLQPRDLTITKLLSIKTLDWSEQKQRLKIA